MISEDGLAMLEMLGEGGSRIIGVEDRGSEVRGSEVGGSEVGGGEVGVSEVGMGPEVWVSEGTIRVQRTHLTAFF